MGDTLLLEGSAESMKLLFDYKELVNLSHPAERPLRRDKAPIAVAAVLLVMGLPSPRAFPLPALALMPRPPCFPLTSPAPPAPTAHIPGTTYCFLSTTQT